MSACDDLVEQTRVYGRRRMARESALEALIGRSVALHPAGFALFDAAALSTADSETAERLLARVAACIGAAPYPARRDRIARLLAGLTEAPGRARTLGGCRFVPWRRQILVLRELAAANPPLRVEPGEDVAWDRRFSVTLPLGAGKTLTIGYFGQRGGRLPERYRGDVPRLVHSALPAFWDEHGLAAVPDLGYRRAGVRLLPCVLFRPAHPLARVGFTVV
jgi:tRNA(Ile)-lysidine synthase